MGLIAWYRNWLAWLIPCSIYGDVHSKNATPFFREVLPVLSVKMKRGVRILTHNSPKYLERISASEKFQGFFPLNYAISSFGKRLNY